MFVQKLISKYKIKQVWCGKSGLVLINSFLLARINGYLKKRHTYLRNPGIKLHVHVVTDLYLCIFFCSHTWLLTHFKCNLIVF